MSQATIRTFTAELLDSELDTGEENRQSWEPVRRAALALLTRDYDSIAAPLRQNDDEAGHALIELAEQLSAYLEWRAHDTDLLEAAHARLWLVLGQEADRLDAEPPRIDPGIVRGIIAAQQALDACESPEDREHARHILFLNENLLLTAIQAETGIDRAKLKMVDRFIPEGDGLRLLDYRGELILSVAGDGTITMPSAEGARHV